MSDGFDETMQRSFEMYEREMAEIDRRYRLARAALDLRYGRGLITLHAAFALAQASLLVLGLVTRSWSLALVSSLLLGFAVLELWRESTKYRAAKTTIADLDAKAEPEASHV